MKKKRKMNLILIIFVIVLVLGLGYAYLTTTLNINGTTNIDSNTWDIHFENVQVKSGSVTAATPTIDTNRTTVSYSAHLSKPGDYYEFNIDVKNGGTIDGMIESVISKVNNQPISNLPNYLEYSVTYDDGIEITENQLLTAGSKETYTVHLGFKTDIDPGDLPGNSQTLNLSIGFTDTQATSGASTRPYYVYTINLSPAINIGSTIPNGVTVYDDPYEAADAFCGKYLLRHKIVDEVVIESYVGFIINDEIYYLRGGIDETYLASKPTYEANKNILFSAIERNLCLIDAPHWNNNDIIGTICPNENEPHYRAQSSGYVSADEDGYACQVFSDGSSCCESW